MFTCTEYHGPSQCECVYCIGYVVVDISHLIIEVLLLGVSCHLAEWQCNRCYGIHVDAPCTMMRCLGQLSALMLFGASKQALLLSQARSVECRSHVC